MAGIKRQKRFPIGYRIQNGRAEVVPEEAELVQRIFRDYLEGSTTYGIAKWMTKLGVLNANGHPSWSHHDGNWQGGRGSGRICAGIP